MRNFYQSLKKATLIIAIFIACSQVANSQTAHSQADGNWLNPLTWDCSCIPTSGYAVSISHNVVMNLDYTYNTGSVTVNAGGRLTEDHAGRYFLMNGGSFTNNGVSKLSRVGFYSGTAANTDSLYIYSVFYSGAPMTNSGVITGVDSLYIPSNFTNNANAKVTADNITVTGTLVNNGNVYATNLLNMGTLNTIGLISLINITSTGNGTNNGTIHFTDFTNTGTFHNYSVVDGVANFTNAGDFTNHAGASQELGFDFLNCDTTYHDANYYNAGLVKVVNNFYNVDTMQGPSSGQLCVGQESANSGKMLGTFDFCDNTPPPSAPYINFNTGFIAPGITYCTTNCWSTIEAVSIKNEMTVYPNPVSSAVEVTFANPHNTSYTFILADITGKTVLQITGITAEKFSFTKNNLKPGAYLYHLTGENNSYRGKLVIE